MPRSSTHRGREWSGLTGARRRFSELPASASQGLVTGDAEFERPRGNVGAVAKK